MKKVKKKLDLWQFVNGSELDVGAQTVIFDLSLAQKPALKQNRQVRKKSG